MRCIGVIRWCFRVTLYVYIFNKLEKYFHIIKKPLISRRKKIDNGYTIVSCNKLSTVTLHQNHGTVYFNKMPNIYSKSQYA